MSRTLDLEAIEKRLADYKRGNVDPRYMEYSDWESLAAELVVDDVPALISEVRRLRDELDAWKKRYDRATP